MAAEILAIGNPRKRRKFTAKQRAAGFGGKRSMHARRNPSRKKRRVFRARRNPSTAVAAPARRRRRSTSSAPTRTRRRRFSVYKRAATQRYKRFRRRASGANITTVSGFVNNALLPAGIGAAGALAIDMAWSTLPIPDSFKTGPLAPVTRVAGAVAIGLAAGAVAGRKWGAAAMLGALTVTTYDLAKGWLHTNVPALPGLSAYPGGGMGAYTGRGMGYMSPGQTSFYR